MITSVSSYTALMNTMQFHKDSRLVQVLLCLALFVLLAVSQPAAAYIGPGAGVSFLGSILSTLAVILLAIGAILFWPLRYLWRRMRKQKTAAADANAVINEKD